jgi:GH15 family glucan-1,4-alpha-glucosidase
MDRGLALARECLRKAPVQRWKKVQKQIREAVESEGYDRRRRVFVQAFGSPNLDAALLMLPLSHFLPFEDPRMIRTVDAIRHDLEVDGLILRYRVAQTDDGLQGDEGTFLPCSFWMAEVLARQGRVEESRTIFDRACSTSSELGLFAEEFDTRSERMLGNFPQALTHLSHIVAAVALARATGDVSAAY